MFQFIDHESKDRFYNFVSQSVFAVMTNVDQVGITNDGRLFTVCEQNHRIDIYNKNCFTSSPDECLANQLKSVPCYDVNIQKIIYGTSKNGREYFGVIIVSDKKLKKYNLINEDKHLSESANTSLVRIYTNLNDPSNEERIKNINQTNVFRYNAECSNEYLTNDQLESSTLITNANIIEFQYLKHLPSNVRAIDISSCPINGNFAILLNNSTIVIYMLVECDIVIKNKIIQTIDFNLSKMIEMAWQPNQIRLLYNYLSFMSLDHISLIHLSLDKDYKFYPTVQTSKPNYSQTLNDGITFQEVIYPGLFNPISKRTKNQQVHTIYGPVKNIGCKFVVKNDQNINENYELIFCHDLHSKLNDESNETYFLIESINGSNKKLEKEKTNSIMSSVDIYSKNQKYQLFDLQFLSTIDSINVDKKLLAIVLTILNDNQITIYAIDLRKDYLQLMPISMLIIQPFWSIKNISINIEEGLLHLINGNQMETYVTHINQFLTSDQQKYCAYKQIPKLMFKISSHIFFNIIHLFSSNNFMYLVGQEIINQCTFYRLTRPSIEQLKMDILSKMNDLQEQNQYDNSNSTLIMLKKIQQMYYYLYVLTKFLIEYLNFNNIFLDFHFVDTIDQNIFDQLNPSHKQLLYLIKLNRKIYRFIMTNYPNQNILEE